jgi:Tfp pilus assembly ATPase PilU
MAQDRDNSKNKIEEKLAPLGMFHERIAHCDALLKQFLSSEELEIFKKYQNNNFHIQSLATTRVRSFHVNNLIADSFKGSIA